MTELQNGLFAVEEPMPCSPKAIHLGRYCLPGTLGRAEREEAAARILSFSQRLDQWVGVRWSLLLKMMGEDYKALQKREEEFDRHYESMEVWKAQMKRRFWLCIFTIGLYAFTAKPQEPQPGDELKDSHLPFTGIYLFGPEHVVEGVQQLIKLKLLTCVTEDEGGRSGEVLFPTPALITQIMKVQCVAA